MLHGKVFKWFWFVKGLLSNSHFHCFVVYCVELYIHNLINLPKGHDMSAQIHQESSIRAKNGHLRPLVDASLASRSDVRHQILLILRLTILSHKFLAISMIFLSLMVKFNLQVVTFSLKKYDILVHTYCMRPAFIVCCMVWLYFEH